MLYREQRLRPLFQMLDPTYYTGPDGMLVRHLYGKNNKVVGSKQDSDLQWALIFAARVLQSLGKSSLDWIQSRVVANLSIDK